MRRSSLRSIPSVESILQAINPGQLPRVMVVRIVREELARLRREKKVPGPDAILRLIEQQVAACQRGRLQPVINGTGVIIHTNLGRSLLAAAAIERVVEVSSRYCNLEFDLDRNARGTRSAYLEKSLAALCQAQSATVANNCAAALVLILRHLIKPGRSEVIVSRGELVQIGGGFRIPEILETAGAHLREVGTTNRTTVEDYRRAIGAQTALILKVHRSNFFMEGFVATPATEELSAIARRKRLPLVEDLGSGNVGDGSTSRPDSEPTPAEVLRWGVDLVCFSGDKLLGGPQAGIIAGKSKLIAGLKNDPFFRTVRCDKLVLGALEATVDLHLNGGEAAATIPTLALARVPLAELDQRARQLQKKLEEVAIELRIRPSQAQWGGGSLPGSTIDSMALEIRPRDQSVGALAAKLRFGNPAVLGCIAGGWLRLDLRTMLPGQDVELAEAIRRAAALTP
ncbi:MAG TPA: L-seryl-tRNA(Sec) selenium transferase [Verrucomicrobiae bacterium]|nr:L-seryl-tRNA(Sec) selenium transferase [Verrucomicrobiae bacterium]